MNGRRVVATVIAAVLAVAAIAALVGSSGPLAAAVILLVCPASMVVANRFLLGGAHGHGRSARHPGPKEVGKP